MNRFLKNSARPLAALMTLVILASSLGGLAPAARAQQPTIDNLDLNGSFTPTGPSGFLPSTIVPNTKDSSTPPPSTDTQNKDSAAAKKPTSSAAPADTPPDEVYGSVMVKIMGLFAMLLGIAVVTLDNAVYYTVVDMSNYIKHLSAVGVTWRILRDIGNVVLIFGFLVIGVSIILDLNIYGYGTKMLPKLLIAAVFLNFSLFISEAVIDAGNLFATQFYTQINGGDPPAPVSYRDVRGEGISNRIMGQLSLSNIYGDALNNDPQHRLLSGDTPWYVGFLGILLFLVAAFVIFSLAFILIARFVILVFLIIVAPIGFAGLAVPKLEKSARDWWTQLFEQTITAPILLLMLYVALAVITDAHFLTGFVAPETTTLVWTGFNDLQNLDGFAGLMLSFLVAMGLLLAVTILSKRLGAFGGAWATKAAGALTFGATAYGASALFGGGAFGLRKGIQNYVPENRYTRGAKRAAARGLRFVERSKFDFRSAPGVGTVLKAAGAAEAASPIGKSASGRVRQGAEWLRKSGEESARDYDQETRMARLRQAVSSADYALVARLVGNMSDTEIEKNVRYFTQNPLAAASLTQARFDKFMGSEKLNDGQKNTLRTQRTAGLASRYADNNEFHHSATHQNPALRNQPVASISHPGQNMTRGEFDVRALTNEAATQLPDEVLIQPAVYENLSGRQLTAIANRGAMSDANAIIIGQSLVNNQDFLNYYNAQAAQRQADLRTFYHLNIPPQNQPQGGGQPPGGGGAGQGGGQPPPPNPAAGNRGGGGVPYQPPGGRPAPNRPIRRNP